MQKLEVINNGSGYLMVKESAWSDKHCFSHSYQKLTFWNILINMLTINNEIFCHVLPVGI